MEKKQLQQHKVNLEMLQSRKRVVEEQQTYIEQKVIEIQQRRRNNAAQQELLNQQQSLITEDLQWITRQEELNAGQLLEVEQEIESIIQEELEEQRKIRELKEFEDTSDNSGNVNPSVEPTDTTICNQDESLFQSTSTNTDPQQITCPYRGCDKVFKKEADLKRHLA
uniref:C2H2-type domain-containing protein n=1 Tax=Meloidogyne javanica TaxID=6303 RepID=A0A915MPN8_MELJA